MEATCSAAKIRTGRRIVAGWMMACACTFPVALLTAPAVAANPTGIAARVNQSHAFEIPPQQLASALRAFAQQSGLTIRFDAEVVHDRPSQPVIGQLPAQVALAALLAGSGLGYAVVGPDEVHIHPLPT